jgi:hypothetical protein
MIARFVFYLIESLALSFVIHVLFLPIRPLFPVMKACQKSRGFSFLIGLWLSVLVVNTIFSELAGPDFTFFYHVIIWIAPFSIAVYLFGKSSNEQA